MPATDRADPRRGLAAALRSRTALLPVPATSPRRPTGTIRNSYGSTPSQCFSLPIVSLAAALAIAGVLYRAWSKAGRQRGIQNVAAEAEAAAEPREGGAV